MPPPVRGLIAPIPNCGIWHSQCQSANQLFSTLPARVQACATPPSTYTVSSSPQAPPPHRTPTIALGVLGGIQPSYLRSQVRDLVRGLANRRLSSCPGVEVLTQRGMRTLAGVLQEHVHVLGTVRRYVSSSPS